MNANTVRALVLREIGTNWDRSNLHGVEIRRCLLATPERLSLRAADGELATIEAWLVLLEDPDTRRGYGVVYDEETQGFGLTALEDGRTPCLIGLYGGFFDTLAAL